MKTKLNQIIYLLKEEIRLYLSISICIFLFILFFQPFPLESFDFNNKLLIVSGLSGIIFLFIVLVRTIFPLFINKYERNNNESLIPALMAGFIILSLSSVAFAYYLHYVGLIAISFYIMFKVVLICITSPIILWLNDVIKELKLKNKLLIHEKESIRKEVERYEDDYMNKSIEFISENRSENLKLLISEIAFIKTADNYVEIVYKENESFKMKLLRSTLKNIELQLKPYSVFIRCHRICIVNSHFIEKLNRNYSNFWLSIKGHKEQIPVSRQYLAMIKETL